MAKITYLTGDATSPIGEGQKIICHICNDIGAWGAGFVLAISKKWKEPEAMYRTLMHPRTLGNVQMVRVTENITVANMIAQRDIQYDANGNPPIRYNAVRAALIIVNEYALMNNSTLHMPRIGCGLAGGKWDKIEEIINDVVTVNVYVYDFK